MRRLGLTGLVLSASLFLGGCETMQRNFALYMAKEAWEECSEKTPQYCVASAMYLTYALAPSEKTTSEDISIRNEESP